MRATLASAYGEGLLSQGTLTYRLDQLGVNRVIEPDRLIGDLNLRESQRGSRLPAWLRERVAELWPLSRRARGAAPVVLALDWAGTTETLLLGRHCGCDVVVDQPTVSRRHAQLIFRDGSWVLHDLGSTNGTIVNGARVTRCQLRPGDQLTLGERHLVVD
jgi:hypothetical protein